MNCIYECQGRDLVKIYTPKDHAPTISSPHTAPDNQITIMSLSLKFLPLYPSDCLSLAYYVRMKLKSSSEDSVLIVIIMLCYMTDIGLEIFSNEMSKGIDKVTPGKLDLALGANPIITERANRSITTLLSSGKITYLTLSSCTLPDTVSTTLKCIINGLNNSSLEELKLIDSHINIVHVHYLILLVRMNSNLNSLNLSGNDLNKAIPLLSSALIHSKIRYITLEHCNIDDGGLYCLFEILIHNTNSLYLMNVDKNPITTLGLKKCLSILLEKEQHYPSTLYRLLLSTKTLLKKENKSIIEKINSIRRSLPLSIYFQFLLSPESPLGEESNSTNQMFPPLYVGDGEYNHMMRNGINWAATTKSVLKCLPKNKAKKSSSISAL